ncbi:MAG: hypothetical protein IKJ45_08885 [Kiritimatiellae bacterium]|nr:hypothetical protein [Kiritimatiellia bacterium]
MGIVASCRKGAWIAAVVGILAVLGCGRVAVRDTAAYADGEYLCDVLVPHRESEIVQRFGEPDGVFLGTSRNGLCDMTPSSVRDLPENVQIKECWFCRRRAYCVAWMRKDSTGEWVCIADRCRGPRCRDFVWRYDDEDDEEPERPSSYDRQYLGWTEEAVIEKFGHPQRRGAKYRESGLDHVSWSLEKNAQEATKRTNPETKEYYYNRTNENVQTIFQFAKDPEKGWVVIYDYTLDDDWILLE